MEVLLKKDLKNLAPGILITTLLLLFGNLLAYFTKSRDVFINMNMIFFIVVAMSLLLGSIKEDEILKINKLLSSVGVRREDIIKSKFIFGLIVDTGFMFAVFLFRNVGVDKLDLKDFIFLISYSLTIISLVIFYLYGKPSKRNDRFKSLVLKGGGYSLVLILLISYLYLNLSKINLVLSIVGLIVSIVYMYLMLDITSNLLENTEMY